MKLFTQIDPCMFSAIFTYTIFMLIATIWEKGKNVMMKKKKKIVVVGIILFFVSSITAFGIDPNDNIMRNDHDTLLIGEIISMDDDEVVIEAMEYIVSAYDLIEDEARRQLRPRTVRVVDDAWMDDFYIGDYVLASLNQEGSQFVVAWGIYPIRKVYELDWEVWRVEARDELTSIILSDFVNQEGRYMYSVKQDGTVVRHQGDADIIIYDPDPPTEIEPRTEEDDDESEEDVVELEREIEEEIVELELEDEEVEETPNTPVYVLSGIAFFGLVAAGGFLAFKKFKK